MQTVAAYIRVSTDDQIEYSPDSQIKAIREYSKRNNLFLPEEFIFIDEGISGRNAEKRPAFMKMIAAAKIKPKPFESILLWKFSRFARNREDSIVYKSMLRKQYGIDVISISEQLGEDKTSILIEALLEAMDEYYSINLAEEVKRGMTEKASRGEVVSNPPFGYNVKDNMFIPNMETAPIVKMIYNDYLSGMGCRDIAIKLNNKGIKTKRGNDWENRTVEYILRNIVYTGKITWTTEKKKNQNYYGSNTIIADGRHEPIIEQNIFEEVQFRLEKIKKAYTKYARQNTSSFFMLKGLVRCSSCGATLTSATKGQSLQCHSYAKGKCQVSHSILLSKINKAVLQGIENDIESSNFKIELDKTKIETNNLNAMLIEKECQKLVRVKKAYENGIDTIDEYKENKLKILDHISKLKKEKQTAENTDWAKKIFSGKIFSVLEQLKRSDVSENEKNILIRSFISKIIYYKNDGKVAIFYYN